MNQRPVQHQDDEFRSHTLACEGTLSRFCKALMAVDVQPNPRGPLTVVPHGSVLLSMQFAAGADPFARATERGALPHVCTWRGASHTYQPLGGCRTFFALLTPEGAVALANGQALSDAAGPRQPLASWLDRAAAIQLEDALARDTEVDVQLRRFGLWLEQRLASRLHLPSQATRAARIAASMLQEPVPNIEALAAGEGLSRRQLERDFRRSLAISPKQASLVARGQAAAKLAFRGMAPADIAHHLHFTDQPHLNRVTKQLFGVSPPLLARPVRTAMSAAFRAATGGGLVYL